MSRPSSSRETFEAHALSYADEVQHSIAFAGTEHEFFVRRKTDHLVDIARRLFGNVGQLTVLDAGCGNGNSGTFIANEFGAVHGFDVAVGSLAEASRRNVTVRYLACDGEALPYADASIDLAFATCVLHHVAVARRPAFVDELRRVVRPGGAIVVFEHNPFNLLTRWAVRGCEFDRGVKLLSRRTSASLLRQCGLHVVESANIIFFTFDRPLTRRVEAALRHVPLGAQHYVVARR
jgi:SAM-dependent methyltransferase